MTMVKYDISGNILRLQSKYSSNTSRYNYLYSIV
ncbi:unnamed protein product [Coffea canephora]|uniref:Uncharacterized protein n=1 Tax=Coffea canephora TaxID=49390 RepID=A0A068TSJ6_COFCA|nr:unnamed protein product [Coffea canephora]